MTFPAASPATSLLAPSARPRLLALGAGALCALIATAATRRLAGGAPILLGGTSPWLLLHLATVIPALPLGAYLLVRRKGDRVHRLLGRLWAGLMMTTAAVSFGVRTSGHLSWIHLFSVLVLATVPRAVIFAVRGDIARHRIAIQRIHAGLIAAGLFTFLPGRLLGTWLFG